MVYRPCSTVVSSSRATCYVGDFCFCYRVLLIGTFYGEPFGLCFWCRCFSFCLGFVVDFPRNAHRAVWILVIGLGLSEAHFCLLFFSVDIMTAIGVTIPRWVSRIFITAEPGVSPLRRCVHDLCARLTRIDLFGRILVLPIGRNVMWFTVAEWRTWLVIRVHAFMMLC